MPIDKNIGGVAVGAFGAWLAFDSLARLNSERIGHVRGEPSITENFLWLAAGSALMFFGYRVVKGQEPFTGAPLQGYTQTWFSPPGQSTGLLQTSVNPFAQLGLSRKG